MNKIEKFWHEFQMNKASLSGETPSPQAMDHLLEILETVDPRLYYHLRSTNEGTELILSAEGYVELLPTLANLKATAPKFDDWKFITAYEGMLLFGERNERVFPISDNENGDVLFRMASHGDDLSKPRDINFSVVFNGKAEVQQFVENFRKLGFEIGSVKSHGLIRRTYDVTVTTHMIPSYDAITSFEQKIENAATTLGGKNDGWGCFQQ